MAAVSEKDLVELVRSVINILPAPESVRQVPGFVSFRETAVPRSGAVLVFADRTVRDESGTPRRETAVYAVTSSAVDGVWESRFVDEVLRRRAAAVREFHRAGPDGTNPGLETAVKTLTEAKPEG